MTALKGAVACRGKVSLPLRGAGIRASIADKAPWTRSHQKVSELVVISTLYYYKYSTETSHKKSEAMNGLSRSNHMWKSKAKVPI